MRITIRARVFLVSICAAGVLVLVAASALAGVVKGGSYRGSTSERGETVSFKVSANGTRVLKFTTRLGYDGKCGQGGGPSYEVHVASIKLHSNGSFKTSTTGTLGPLRTTITVSGRIKGKKATGVVEQASAFHCTAPPNVGASAYRETFTAKAP